MYALTASPAPSPVPPPAIPAPDYSFIEKLHLGWLTEGLWAMALLVVGVLLIAWLIHRLVTGWGVHAAVPAVAGTAALGVGIWWWIDSTNQMPEQLRPFTSIGVIIVLVGLGFVAVSRSST